MSFCKTKLCDTPVAACTAPTVKMLKMTTLLEPLTWIRRSWQSKVPTQVWS